MKSLAAAAFVVSASIAVPANADEHPVVVELFTSQGCSSCPAADKLFLKLTKRDDVIPLALHVDYWDYIGWKDEYASPAYTQRQKAYAHAGGRQMIYTPQMVINGQQDLVGVQAMELADLIARHREQPVQARIKADREGGQLVIRLAPAAGPLDGPYDVQLVRYTPLKTANITRGENAGRSLDYANIVDNWDKIGQWDGVKETQIRVNLTGELPAVVLVQERGPGAIIAAALAD